LADLSPYVGRWVALVSGHVAGVGSTADKALHIAKRNRPKEKPQLIFVSPGLQAAQAAKHYPLIEQVFDLTARQGVPTYLVGGTVRDLILGQETHDLDFAVSADGLSVARYIADELEGAYVPLDSERRTGRVLLSSTECDGGPGKAASVLSLDIASLRGEDLTSDLADRDFTINAMALERTPEGDWRLHDPLDGCGDLENRKLRATSPTSFAQDPIRTLRAVRMQAQFGCTVEPETRRWLEAAVPLFEQVSAERIRDEWFKILDQPTASQALRELHQLGLLERIAPPAAGLEGLGSWAPSEPDALSHALATVRVIEQLWAGVQGGRGRLTVSMPDGFRAIAPYVQQRYTSPICDQRTRLSLLKCACLLHQVGEPEMPEANHESRGHAIEQEKRSAEIAAELGRQWRCSGAEIAMLRTAVGAQQRVSWLAAQPDLSPRAIHRFFRDAGEHGLDASLVCLADFAATWESAMPTERWKRHVYTVSKLWKAYYEEQDTVVAPLPLIDGNDLMDELGLSPGPEIGGLLAKVREAQAAGELHTRAEAMTYARAQLTRSRSQHDPQ